MPQHLSACINALSAWALAWRVPLLAIALSAFGIGSVLAIRSSGISASDLRMLPLLALLLVLIPATIAYSAINLSLMAYATGERIGFRDGVRISALAQVAEILPLPGGAMVRTLALMKVGIAPGRSAELVIAFALLWIACGGIGAGLALQRLGDTGWHLSIASGLSVLLITGWLAYRCDPLTALAAVGLRIAGIGLFCLRLSLAFAAIGLPMAWIDSAPFAFAAILGSASGIFPAGLGVSEGLSALVAHGSGVDPARAFLAAALSRMLGLGVNLLLATLFVLHDRRKADERSFGRG